MEDDRVKMIVRERLLDAGMTEKQADRVIRVLNDAPERYRNLYLLALMNYESVITVESQYSNGDNWLRMYWNKPVDEFDPTYFHESGHAVQLSPDGKKNVNDEEQVPVDEETARMYNSWGMIDAFCTDQVYDAIRRDTENYIRDQIAIISEQNHIPFSENDYKRIIDAFINPDRSQVYDIVNDDYVHSSLVGDPTLTMMYCEVRDRVINETNRIENSNACMIKDLISGMTNLKIDTGFTHYDEEYWYKNSGETTYLQMYEGWAEYFSAMIRKDETNIRLNESYFPETTARMDELSGYLYDYYIDYYTWKFGEE